MVDMDKTYSSDTNGPKVQVRPDLPETTSPKTNNKTKPATPDIIQFNDETQSIELMTQLLFEDIGGIELLTISRNDILNGQNVSYKLISNTSELAKVYGPKKLVEMPGSIDETFKNFGLKFSTHVPDEGTGPLLYYVGDFNSAVGCDNYPIINRYTGELVGCSLSYLDAQKEAEALSPPRSPVYSDPTNGDIVIDVQNMLPSELVDVEILDAGQLEDDTIY